jgi:hypothetical protein
LLDDRSTDLFCNLLFEVRKNANRIPPLRHLLAYLI